MIWQLLSCKAQLVQCYHCLPADPSPGKCSEVCFSQNISSSVDYICAGKKPYLDLKLWSLLCHQHLVQAVRRELHFHSTGLQN